MYSLNNIIQEGFDAYLRSWAHALASYPHPVLMRFAHEMSYGQASYPWAIGINGNTAAQYVQAWHHVRQVFRDEGATNVQWVWCPNVDRDGSHPFEAMFPGDSEVDWIALDGYNWDAQGKWSTFTDVFSMSYQRITVLSKKPFMIGETSSTEIGGNKAQWIAQAFGVEIPTAFPRLKALVWFNAAVDNTDWRFESSATSQSAFSASVSPPLYLSQWE